MIFPLSLTLEDRAIVAGFDISNKDVYTTKLNTFTIDPYESCIERFLSDRGDNKDHTIKEMTRIISKIIDDAHCALGTEELWISLRMWPDYTFNFHNWHQDLNTMGDKAYLAILKGPGTRFKCYQMEEFTGCIFSVGSKETATIHSEPYQEYESQRMIIRIGGGTIDEVKKYRRAKSY